MQQLPWTTSTVTWAGLAESDVSNMSIRTLGAVAPTLRVDVEESNGVFGSLGLPRLGTRAPSPESCATPAAQTHVGVA